MICVLKIYVLFFLPPFLFLLYIVFLPPPLPPPTRYESGMYEGNDESNVKLELTSTRMPAVRKVSKMINGLGEDM